VERPRFARIRDMRRKGEGEKRFEAMHRTKGLTKSLTKNRMRLKRGPGKKKAKKPLTKIRHFADSISESAKGAFSTGRIASYKGDINRNVEALLLWKGKLSNESFLVDVLCTKKKKLPFADDMSHIVIRTISSVSDIDIFGILRNGMTIHNCTECFEFILIVNRLQERVRIGMCMKVIKGIDVYTIDTFCRITR
jgi:hypothetical protein